MMKPTDIQEAITLGILLPETHFPICRTAGVIADAVARVGDDGFYQVIEIADIPGADDRRRIGSVVRARGLRLTYWTTWILAQEGLNLSSLDDSLRARTVRQIRESFGPAAECGASRLAVVSGPDPGADLRARATEQLYLSLRELAEEAKAFSMRLCIEPLDREAHKRQLIGPTTEAAELMRRVRQETRHIGLSFDTAHAALCGEDPGESLATYSEVVDQVHLANAVLDPADPMYGDYHMAVGAPGFLTVNRIAEIIARGMEAGVFGSARTGVSMEMRTAEGGDPWATERLGRETLLQAWELYVQGANGR